MQMAQAGSGTAWRSGPPALPMPAMWQRPNGLLCAGSCLAGRPQRQLRFVLDGRGPSRYGTAPSLPLIAGPSTRRGRYPVKYQFSGSMASVGLCRVSPFEVAGDLRQLGGLGLPGHRRLPE